MDLNNSANVSRTDLQETQFAPSSVVDAVNFDESERAVYYRSDNVTSGQITPVEGSIRLSRTQDPDDPLKPLSTGPSSSSASARVLAPDLLRGFIMVLQAIDHAAVTATSWGHGQAIIGEQASKRVTRWNEPIGYTARLFTHLCAPGFMFLLGMGVVYFGRSRAKLGWTSAQMVKHFFIRAAVLALINYLIGLLVMRRPWPILNIVLLALAFNYFFSGLIWLALNWTEKQTTQLLVRVLPDPSRDPETQSLLHTNSSNSTRGPPVQDTAAKISFHVHNVILLLLSIITIWWNIWLDPHQGHCPIIPSDPADLPHHNAWFEFFFHELTNKYIYSGFPPLAWLSPAILGLLYARIVLSRPWKPLTVNLGNIAASLLFITLFILTRLLHFGNLDEDCLAMPEHVANPTGNQYLASVRSFFYITKYPPSPSYIFFAMSANFLALGLFGFVPAKVTRFVPFSVLLVFGTSALFFYTIHLPLYAVLGSIAKALFGYRMDFDDMMHPGHPAWGVGPGIVFWVDWFLGLLVLWPMCRAYGRFKASKGVDSIWRFF